MKNLKYFVTRVVIVVIALAVLNCFKVSADTKTSDILEQAKIANENFDFEEAFDLTIKAYDENVENPDMWLQMGIALKGMNKYSDAISCLEKVISYAGNRREILSEAYLNLGTIFKEQNLTEQGIQAVNKGLEIDRDNWHLLALRAHLLYNSDKKQAKKDLTKAEKLAPKDPYLFLEESYIYFDAKEYADALKAINRAIELDGKDPVLYFAKGNIHKQLNNVKEASDSYIESIIVSDFDYPFPFVALYGQFRPEDRPITVAVVKDRALSSPKLNGILFILMDNWEMEGADEIYDEMVRKNDRETNHYFRVSKNVVDYIGTTSPRGEVSKETEEDHSTVMIPIVDPDKVKIEVMDSDSKRDTPKSENRTDQVFVAVEQPAEFPGGQKSLMDWLSQNIRYPFDAQLDAVQGRTLVRFVVEKDGSISNVVILKRNDPSLDAEAIRVVKGMPKWIPGKNQGVPVRSYFTLPITFRLNI